MRGRAPTVHTSLYAEDAAIFMILNKDYINYLASILQKFGVSSGL
jgi:hypothetical protein